MTVSNKIKIALGSGVVGIGLLAAATLAAAAVTPTVTATIQNGSNVNITNALIGTPIHASVTVASSSATTSPTGTVDFNFYSGNQVCSGSPLTQTGVALVNGAATSSTTTVPAGGLSYIVHYGGQTDLYTTADSVCVGLSANQFSPSITTTLSTSSVLAGSSVYDSATLNNASSSAGGSVSYKVFTNNSCSNLALDAGSKVVTNGSVPNSDSWQFITPGTYYWQVVYSGDASNAAATSTCSSEVLSVIATSTPVTPPPVTGPGTISGTVFNDLNKDDTQNGGEPGLAGWTVWLHKADATSTPWWKKIIRHDGYDDPIVATATTDANGNYSFGSLASGMYFVEEQVKTGWNQTSSDGKVVLDANKTSADVDFANVEKGNKGNDNGHATSTHATSTDNGNHGHDKDNDNDNDDATSTNNGNHNGWFKFNGNITGWFHFGKK